MIKKNEFIFTLILILLFFSLSFLKVYLKGSVPIHHQLNKKEPVILTLTKDELIKIKGIGEKTSDLILSNLEEDGTIDIENLKKIKGIGDKRISLILERFYDKGS